MNNPDHKRTGDFLASLAREAGQFTSPQVPQKPRLYVPPVLRDGDIHLGCADVGGDVGGDLGKLIDGRLLVQGSSGAGKSWTLRRLLEQSVTAIQQIVVDPEGEFVGLADRFGHMQLDAAKLDIAALTTAAAAVRTHRLSVRLDLSDCEREDQLIAVAAFLRGLVDAPREDWHPAVVVIDEAHLFAPFGGDASAPSSVRKTAIGALVDLMCRGRKRGLGSVLATQRLARLSKSVASEAVNFLVGRNTLDLDIRRAAETIGWDARRAFDRLPMLEPGDFVAVGPAFSRSPCVLRIGGVETEHRGAAPGLVAPPLARSADQTRALLDVEGLIAASRIDEGRRADGGRTDSVRIVRGFIRDPGFSLSGQVVDALTKLAPAGARLSAMAKEFSASPLAVAEACALLDRYGVLEFSGAGDARAARLSGAFRT